MGSETVFIGFGSNLGDRRDYCDRAVTLLRLLPHSNVTGVSSLYQTEPIDTDSAPGSAWFYNGVVRLETNLAARSLLEICQEVERGLGRERRNRNAPRTMDLDILFYGYQTINETHLTIPHPRLYLRRFVLAPLVELDPGLVPSGAEPKRQDTFRSTY